MEAILSIQNLSKEYTQGNGTVPVLKDLTFQVYQGDFTVIMGASGAGKSTLLYCLSGMDRPSTGQIIYQNRDIAALGERALSALRAGDFGFVFQQPQLVSNLTVLENVLVAGFLGGKDKETDIRSRADRLLWDMGLSEVQNHYPHEISGGEAQRAAVARAMIAKPALLFADEPTGALNRSHTDRMLSLLTELHRQGQSIVLVTHDVRCAVRGSRILYLEDGTLRDELRLSAFEMEAERERETTVHAWLSGLNW